MKRKLVTLEDKLRLRRIVFDKSDGKCFKCGDSLDFHGDFRVKAVKRGNEL